MPNWFDKNKSPPPTDEAGSSDTKNQVERTKPGRFSFRKKIKDVVKDLDQNKQGGKATSRVSTFPSSIM